MEKETITVREFRAKMKLHLERAEQKTIYICRGKKVYRLGMVPQNVYTEPTKNGVCTHGKEAGFCMAYGCINRSQN